MEQAVAGNVIQVGPGVYTGPQTGDHWLPSFAPANSGTVDDLIIIYAQLPASTNPDAGRQLSKLRNNGPQDADHSTYGVRGYASAQHVIWDGFWVDQDDGAQPQPSGGQCALGGATGVEIRRGLFDRADVAGGDNYASIFAQETVDCVICDCLFRGGTSDVSGTRAAARNDAAISMYGNDNLTIEHSTFADNPNNGYSMGTAIFVKGSRESGSNSGTIRYCRISGLSPEGSQGIEINAASSRRGGMDIHNNVVVGGGQCIGVDNSSDESKRAQIFNNTFVDTSGTSADWGGVVGVDPHTEEGDITFYDNIVVHFADADAAGDFRVGDDSPARTASSRGGVVGAYGTGNEEVGVRPAPSY